MSSPQSNSLLQCGGRLREWVLENRDISSSLSTSLLLRWNAFWFDRHWKATVARIKHIPLPEDPIFIVGLWRSGTTHLHEQLSALPGLTTPSTWECFHPAISGLMKPPLNGASEVRPMDSSLVSADSPQEDEFALLLLGDPTLYRVFIDPSRLGEIASSLLLNPALKMCNAQPDLTEHWENFLRMILYRRPGRLLLKSPNHTFRVPWLSDRFKKSRFIWIIRDRAEVERSNLRMWEAMTNRYARSPCHRNALEAFISKACQLHDEYLGWARENLSARLTEIEFKDVVSNNSEAMCTLKRSLSAETTLRRDTVRC